MEKIEAKLKNKNPLLTSYSTEFLTSNLNWIFSASTLRIEYELMPRLMTCER